MKQNPTKRYKQRTNLTLNPRLKREALRYIAESEDPGRPLSDLVEDGLRLIMQEEERRRSTGKTPRK